MQKNPLNKLHDFDLWSNKHSKNYESNNYSKGLAGFCMRKGHSVLENKFNSSYYFKDTLEVGAGSGVHFEYINHGYDKYIFSDANISMLDLAKSKYNSKNLSFLSEDAKNLSFADNSFDRVIACHVLEHLSNPIASLMEWHRVSRPDGIISILLPCDPGLIWRLGRNFGPRRNFKKLGLPYDFIMANEHINSITNLVAIIRYLFEDIDEDWWPLSFPSSDLNLFYCVHINVKK